MLTFEQPPRELNGLLVYADHAVPTHFYYAAPNPSIAQSAGGPMFDLHAYTVALEHSVLEGTRIPDELGAGFLTMGVECVVSDSVLSTVRAQLAELTNQDEDRITLSPIPYRKGQVRVVALDRSQTPGEETQPGDVQSADRLKGRPTFVEDVLGASTPSLLGNLRAIFSLTLSQNGVAFIQGLYADGAAPVGVVYDLEFQGLRPAVEARIHANMSRVYKHFGGGLGVQYNWLKADVQAGLDYLEQQGDVDIELTSQMTGEEAQKSKELALSLFKDRIIQELFRPTSPQGGTPGQAGNVVRHAAEAVSGQGAGTSGSNRVSLTLRADLSFEDRRITYDFRERVPETQIHAPQAFLPLLLDEETARRHTHVVDLEADFFDLLQITVAGPTPEEFDRLGIRQVELGLQYGKAGDNVAPERRDLLFRKDSTGDKTVGFKRRGRDTLAYNYSVAYEFEPRPGVDTDTLRYDVPTRTSIRRSLLINPYGDFGVLQVELEPGHIPASIDTVDAQLVYTSPSGTFDADTKFRLDLAATDSPHPRWQVRTREAGIAPYQAVYTFVFDDGAVYTTEPTVHDDSLLRIDAPFASERSLLIRPNVVADSVTQVVLEVEYDDEDNDYHRHFLVTLEKPFETHELTWPILDTDLQTIRYRETTFEPGFTNQGEWQETSDSSVIVGEKNTRSLEVTVRLIGPALETVQVDALLVKFEPLVAGAAVNPAELFFESQGETTQPIKATLPPEGSLRYRYQVTAFHADGQTRVSDWREGDGRIVVISTRNV